MFIIYMDKCLRHICRERTEVLETFVYADDVALIAVTAEQLQEETERWSTGLERNGLKMNKNKTEVMFVGRRREELNIRAGEQQL